MEQAEQIVARHWVAVEALASELLLRRKLDAAQIMDVIVLGPAARRRRSWDQIVAQTRPMSVLFSRRAEGGPKALKKITASLARRAVLLAKRKDEQRERELLDSKDRAWPPPSLQNRGEPGMPT
jgi:hypothetical protein